MKIHVKESTMVRPAEATPCTMSMWISNLDLLAPLNHHSYLVYFFRYNGAPNFFDSRVLKAALSRCLVWFYPVAGRLRWNGNRVEIDCNGEGAMFVDAESDDRMDDFGDLSPKPDRRFIPKVDYSRGICTYPLLLVQVTRFKCGGVCLGVGIEHQLCDGIAAHHFINTWSDIARGLHVTVMPFFDRRVLSARNPPRPRFTHIEYQPFPTLETSQQNDPPIQETSVFKKFELTRDQINILKSKCKESDGKKETKYSTYEVVSGHAWRCITVARKLPTDQATKMLILVDVRSRMIPPLPKGYFGNAVTHTAAIATAGELESKPLKFTVGKIHDAIVRIDHDYAISALDYLELQHNINSFARGPRVSKCPNMVTNSWAKLPCYDADFGWGRPVYEGPGSVAWDGKTCILPSPTNDGRIWFAITLPEDQMKLFQKEFYGYGICTSKI